VKCYGWLANWANRATKPAACIASLLLPDGSHSGKGARRAIVALQATTVDAKFPQAMLEAAWRAQLLHHHVSRLRMPALAAFLEEQVDYAGALAPAEILQETRPLIFATPHYGAPAVGCLALAHLMRGRRVLNVFYDKERHGAEIAPFLERGGLQATASLGGLAGVRAALRALGRGECLAMLPDAFNDVDPTLVVPFFGRLLRVASGVAFLALRSRALIVPAFAVPRRKFGLGVTFAAPIDPLRIAADDERQALFTLTHLLFTRIEAQLRLAPQHWRYWSVLPQVSTALDTPASLSEPRLIEALRAKLHALPPAVQDIPELELLLE
jgi:lauroyl/myristoyl acyltransferase